MRPDRPQTVLELDIVDVQVLRQDSRNFALGLVDIGLHSQTAPLGKVAIPTAEQICSGNMRVLVIQLVERASITIALQCEAVRRSAPVGAKTDLPLAPAVVRRRPVRGGGVEDIEDPAVSPI